MQRREEDQADRASHAGLEEGNSTVSPRGGERDKERKVRRQSRRAEGEGREAETKRKRVETGVETEEKYKREGADRAQVTCFRANPVNASSPPPPPQQRRFPKLSNHFRALAENSR